MDIGDTSKEKLSCDKLVWIEFYNLVSVIIYKSAILGVYESIDNKSGNLLKNKNTVILLEIG